MIEREYGQSFLSCDSCNDWHRKTYDRDEFMQMIAEAKEDGWRVRSGGGEWTHTCPRCAARYGDDFDDVDFD